MPHDELKSEGMTNRFVIRTRNFFARLKEFIFQLAGERRHRFMQYSIRIRRQSLLVIVRLRQILFGDAVVQNLHQLIIAVVVIVNESEFLAGLTDSPFFSAGRVGN